MDVSKPNSATDRHKRTSSTGYDGPDYARTGADIRTTPPADEGFYFPAEWTPHERTLMQFLPPQNFSRRDIAASQREWSDVANAVAFLASDRSEQIDGETLNVDGGELMD